MGKRELLLVACFVIVGVVVYQATAPPAGPNERGLSLSRLLDHARREIRGTPARAEITTTSTHPTGDDVTELRITDYVREVHVTGGDGAEIETDLYVRVNAYDDAEAAAYAKQTVLETDRAGSSMTMRIQYPKGGRHWASLTVRIPSRLGVRIESRPDKLTISNVSGVEAANAGGETTITKIAGRVTVTHRGGPIVIEDAAAVRLTGRGSSVTLRGVRGDASITMEQGGRVSGSQLAGPLDVDSRNAEVSFEDLAPTRGPIRVNAIGGSVRLEGLRSDIRIDGRNSRIDVAVAGAAPVAIRNEGQEISLKLPPGGYRLDAIAIEGRISPETVGDDLGIEYVRDARETRLTGEVKGGGPTISIRNTRGDVTLSAND